MISSSARIKASFWSGDIRATSRSATATLSRIACIPPTSPPPLKSGSPRWNPCEVITYKVNTTGAPKNGLKMTKKAFKIVAEATGLTTDQVERVYGDIDQKRKTTAYLHLPPQLVEPVEEIG